MNASKHRADVEQRVFWIHLLDVCSIV